MCSRSRYAISVVLEHGGNAHTEPQVKFARDILTFAQTRDTLGKPTAYPPVNSADAAPMKQQARMTQTPVQKLAQNLPKAGD